MDSTFPEHLDDAAARWGVPAMVVGVSGPGTIRMGAHGCSTDTRFRIASLTKPVTALAAVRRLSLEASAPGWPGVTVADLLSHMSGYDCELGDLTRFGAGDDALERLAAELPACRRWLPPGEIWSYANTGYWLLGHLLAVDAGRPYEEVIGDLADEAALTSTAFGEPDIPGTGPGAVSGPYPRARRPSGGLVSDIDDLLRFGDWLMRQPEFAAMTTPRGHPVRGVYGLGLFGEQVGEVSVWGHSGSYGGFQSSLLVVPERHAVFAGLTNSGRGAQALRELEDEWLEGLLGARRPVAATLPRDALALRGLEGVYENDDLRAVVTAGGPGLVVRVEQGGEAEELQGRPIGPVTFEIVEGDSAGYRFDFPRPGFARIGSRLSARADS